MESPLLKTKTFSKTDDDGPPGVAGILLNKFCNHRYIPFIRPSGKAVQRLT